MNIVVAGLGTSALAGVMAVMQLNSISFMPAFAIASAGSIFVGHAIGAKRQDDVPRTVKLTLITAASWMGIVGVACLAAPLYAQYISNTDPFRSNINGEVEIQGEKMAVIQASTEVFAGSGSKAAEP